MGRLIIQGHAIVTADGMIADEAGEMPPCLRNEADWQAFQASLDLAVLVVLGRLGHARHPNPGRRRLVLTRSVAALAADPLSKNATLWNPSGLDLSGVLAKFGLHSGTIAVTGGTGAFDLFLGRYDRFALAEAHRAVLPGGTPCFYEGHPRFALSQSGLRPRAIIETDPAKGVTTTLWERP